MFDIPILIIIFNRPNTTEMVFEKIRAIKPKQLFIAADGPRDEQEKELCNYTRCLILNAIDWDCEIKTLFQVENLGCGLNPSLALTWFFEHVEEGIILEDDCVPDLSFFQYCKQMLDQYRNEYSIISISGCNFGYSIPIYTHGFSNFFNMWGWATWKRSVLKIDYQILEWKQKTMIQKYLFLFHRLNLSHMQYNWMWLRHWLYAFNEFDNKDIWDFAWIYSALSNKQLSVIPKVNLINNIGFLDDATHTSELNHPLKYVKPNTFTFPIDKCVPIKNDKYFEKYYVKNVWCNFIKYSRKTQISFFLKDIYSLFIDKFR